MKYLLLILSFVFIISIVSGATLQPVKLNSCVDLTQSCSNCTFVNITSVIYPNGSKIVNNVAMTKQGTEFNYTFCDTKQIGEYTYVTFGNPDGYLISQPVTFDVNPQGKNYSTVDGLIYGIAIIVLIGIFLLSLYAFVVIPFENLRGSDGTIVQVSYKKYLKIFAFMMCYVTLVGISYFLWNISYGIIQFTELASFFYFVFRLLFVGLLLLVPVTAILTFVGWLKDMSMNNKIMRGLTIR